MADKLITEKNGQVIKRYNDMGDAVVYLQHSYKTSMQNSKL